MSNGPKAFFDQTDLKHVQTTRYLADLKPVQTTRYLADLKHVQTTRYLGQKTFRLESSRSVYTASYFTCAQLRAL